MCAFIQAEITTSVSTVFLLVSDGMFTWTYGYQGDIMDTRSNFSHN